MRRKVSEPPRGQCSLNAVIRESASNEQTSKTIWALAERIQALVRLASELAVRNRRLSKQNHDLADQATHDGLTGLLNRRAFREHLINEIHRAERSGSPLSLIVADLDRFKKYNDRFGHPAGDRALAAAARLLESSVRATDYTARIGGEEFAILLPDTNAPEACRFCRRLIHNVEQSPGPNGPITMSLGIATYRTGQAPEALLEQADIALYYSKRHGRARATHFDNISLLRSQFDCAVVTVGRHHSAAQ